MNEWSLKDEWAMLIKNRVNILSIILDAAYIPHNIKALQK